MRRAIDLLLLATAFVLGAMLRFRDLARPSLWLDEILDYDIASRLAGHPTLRWWSVSREHGPLFFATELAGRAVHSIELSARLAPAILGVAAVVLAWAVGRRGFAFGTGGFFAILLAASPLHVYYSREARPYALLMLLAIALLGTLLRARSVALSAAILLAMALTSATAAPLLAAALLASALAFALEREKERKRFFGRVALAAGVCTALVPLLYRGSAAAAEVPMKVPSLLQAFAMHALETTPTHSAAYAVALLAMAGAIVLLRRDRVAGAIVVGMALLPVAIALLALTAMHHWYSVRYVAAALPAYLLLAAIGLAALVRERWWWTIALPVVVVAAIVRFALPAARVESLQKLDWRPIAASIAERAHDGDLVIATNDWSYVCVEFYLREQPKRLRVIDAMESVGSAAGLVAGQTPAWIVSAGEHRNPAIRDWSCRYPIVLASPLESFRLHYAPTFAHLLANRAAVGDRRAFAERFPAPLTLGMGPESEPFLDSGFAGAEEIGGDFARWVSGIRGTLLLPSDVPTDRRITIRMLPLLRGVPQSVMVTLNGEAITAVTMAPRWEEYSFDIPAARWRSGVNALTLTFAWSAVPSPRDPRSLAAMIDEVRLSGGGPPPGASLTRIAAPTLEPPAVERHPRRQLLLKGADRAALAHLIARLGFDPPSTLQALDRGEVRIETLANAIVDDADCRSDGDFIRLAFAILFEERIDGVRVDYYANQLRHGVPRREIVRRLVVYGPLRAKLHAVAD